ncbi:MAG: 2-C-methyl-D-erythritol 4-phosphate cytidylyltransferase [Bacteroidales bacterium]|nr:2-C-methyl-D-erythritol 4-phosphate cytidylyltransferase [Bacteroidales bacterium]
MKRYVLIVAGGSGMRMGTATPKQFLLLAGKPLLMHTISRLYRLTGESPVTVVLPEEHVKSWEALVRQYSYAVPHSIVTGGAERFHSVKNGLDTLPDEGFVAIHDGVRPFVSADTIDRLFREAEKSGAAIPVIAPPESVRMVTIRGTLPVNREAIRLVQTPQVFRLDSIKNAYTLGYNPLFTDDATVAEQSGVEVSIVEGNRENIKITTPADMMYAEAIISSETGSILNII